MKTDAQRIANELVEAIKDRFMREIGPLQDHVRGLAARLDRQNQRIEELERALAAMEAKAAGPEAKSEGSDRWLKAV